MIGSVHLGGRKNGQRGRPRKWDEGEGIIGAMLHIRRVDEGDTITLHISGTVDLSTVLRLRDVAFTAIGARPRVLCLDLRAISHTEIAGINTLITISRVARLVHVSCLALPSAALREILMETGLTRMLPCEPSLPLSGVECHEAAEADIVLPVSP